MDVPALSHSSRGRTSALAVCAAALALWLPLDAWADQPAALAEERDEMTEKVTVIATRLADQQEAIENLPAHVTRIDREQIERSGVRTLQDLLLFEAGAMLHDQVGNDIEKTFDLRGFGNGSATKVFLDGAPINDPRNNSLALDMIPVDSLDRVEIIRGSAAALGGSGSEGGVIHLVSRRAPEELSGSLSAAAGSFDSTRVSGTLGGTLGGVDFFFSGSDFDTDGFRDNAGGDVRRLAGTAGMTLPGGGRLELSVLDADSEMGNPGALTSAEIANDPTATPFNSLDFSDETFRQVTVNYRGALPGPFTLATNLFARGRNVASLTTGRSASLFGGFFLDTDTSVIGSTLQVDHVYGSNSSPSVLTMGVEWLDGETEALGISTPGTDPGQIDPLNLASDTRTDRRTQALFIQNSWHPSSSWTLLAGARADRDRVGYVEAFPVATNVAALTFSEVSLRAGATWAACERYSIYASYGEAFLPPTVEQLFAFPTFGSNPDLRPQDSRSIEFGFRRHGDPRAALHVALFVVETENEIIFDPGSPRGLFGANVNAGEARRKGVETSFRGRLTETVELFANLTLMDAQLRAGSNAGNDVPLVPEEQLAVGFNVDLPAGVGVRADAVYVGEQVLDNDDANQQPRLDAYTVVNTRVTWRLPRVQRLELFAEARNLFDERYATRGIFAIGDAFLTPAPGRRYLTGAAWRF